MRPLTLILLFDLLLMAASASGQESAEVPRASYEKTVRTCLDTLMAKGRDTYGERETPVLVSILDLDTLQCPEEPAVYDEPWRVIRRHRRNPAGADLCSDMATLHVMNALGGEYAGFARAYAAYYLREMVSPKTSLLCWGWHEYYDVFKDACHFEYHEIQAGVDPIDWDFLWEVDPEATLREINAIWEWHVIDKSTGEVNRHGDKQRGCDFSMSAGIYIEAFTFAFVKTGDPVWMDRAKLLATYYWHRRNPETNLFPDRPNAGGERFDGSHFVTSITGPFCGALLRAYSRTREPLFRDQALTYLRTYGKYGYDAGHNAYWGSLRLDGSPNDTPRVLEDDYAKYEPRGYLDLWEPYLLGYQFPLMTAASYLEAYRVSEDPVFLDHARRFADWALNERPGKGGIQENTWYGEYARTLSKEGTYAGNYGDAITLLLGVYRVTKEAKYLDGAREYADEALEKLYQNGLFRGHPAKPYYEAVDGVGVLLQALLELEKTP